MLKKRFQSIKHAINGLEVAFRNEIHIRIHVAISLLVLILAFLFDCTYLEICILLLVIGATISLELINTSIEHIANVVQPNIDIRIKVIKDISAAAVLFMAIIAIVIGFFIFIPKIMVFLD